MVLVKSDLLQFETFQTIKNVGKKTNWLPSTSYHDELHQLKPLKILEKPCKIWQSADKENEKIFL